MGIAKLSTSNLQVRRFSHLALEIVIFFRQFYFKRLVFAAAVLLFVGNIISPPFEMILQLSCFKILVEGLFYLHVKQLLFCLAFLDLNGKFIIISENRVGFD